MRVALNLACRELGITETDHEMRERVALLITTVSRMCLSKT